MFFFCALLLLNSTGYPPQYPDIVSQPQSNSLNFLLPKFERKKSNFEDSTQNSPGYKLYTMFTYDAETLRDKVATDSILTNHRTPPFVLYLLNNFDYSTPRYTLLKQNNFYDDQSGFNALHLPRSFEFISFYALLKEQSPTNNLEMDGLVKIEPSDIYASKYYPSRSNYTDHGHILNLGARIELPVLENWHEPLQLIVFVDSSPITMDQYSWATELNHTTINGAGFGISWTHIDNFSLQVYFANELDNQVLAIPPTLSHLFWVQAVKHF